MGAQVLGKGVATVYADLGIGKPPATAPAALPSSISGVVEGVERAAAAREAAAAAYDGLRVPEIARSYGSGVAPPTVAPAAAAKRGGGGGHTHAVLSNGSVRMGTVHAAIAKAVRMTRGAAKN